MSASTSRAQASRPFFKLRHHCYHFTNGSFQAKYDSRLNKWDEAERAEIMAELDAAYFHLYGIDRVDAQYILSTFKGIHDRTTLFPDNACTAQRILQKYAEMSFPG